MLMRDPTAVVNLQLYFKTSNRTNSLLIILLVKHHVTVVLGTACQTRSIQSNTGTNRQAEAVPVLPGSTGLAVTSPTSTATTTTTWQTQYTNRLWLPQHLSAWNCTKESPEVDMIPIVTDRTVFNMGDNPHLRTASAFKYNWHIRILLLYHIPGEGIKCHKCFYTDDTLLFKTETFSPSNNCASDKLRLLNQKQTAWVLIVEILNFCPSHAGLHGSTLHDNRPSGTWIYTKP